jgi:formylglycine-generating enzyme
MLYRIYAALAATSVGLACGGRTLPDSTNGGGGATDADAASGGPVHGGASDAAPAGSRLPEGAPAESAPPSNAADAGDGADAATVEIPGGTFYRTYVGGANGPTGQADPATVSAFRLDTFLVTVGRFRSFVQAWNGGSGYTPPAGSGKHAYLNGGFGLVDAAREGGAGYESGWIASDDAHVSPSDTNLDCEVSSGLVAPAAPDSTWTPSPGNNDNLPINCVTWYEAYAFCIWDGGFLPSEAEWEYASAGGGAQRQYPWGSADPGTGNRYAIYNWYYTETASNIAPVGTAGLGGSLWGNLDMAGEVFEWTLDVYGSYVDPCTDCAALTGASPYRVDRGGDFGSDSQALAPPYRGTGIPGERTPTVGFRCAYAP